MMIKSKLRNAWRHLFSNDFRKRIYYFRRAFAVRAAAETCETDQLDLLVVSPGGVATTALMEHLSNYVRVNHPHDQDDLKHIPVPPMRVRSGLRYLFVYGEIEVIVRSLERRGYLNAQSMKLAAPFSVVMPSPLKRLLFRMAIRRQIKAWMKFCSDQPEDVALTIHYEDIWTSQERLRHFCKISEETFVTTFPVRRTRTSNTA